MGHRAAKDIYGDLQRKIDGLSVRTPDHGALKLLLTELYTVEEAELVCKMPWGLSRLEDLARATGEHRELLERQLQALADKGLVVDLWHQATQSWFFTPSPFVIGIYEFTMMRAGEHADHARRARLFREYMESGEFFHANFGAGQEVFVARALPHTDTLQGTTTVLSHDDVRAIVEGADRFSVGICSCRHEQEHTGGRTCATPLETCTAMGWSADYLIRHQMGRSISRTEMLEIVARSREEGLVLSADNVKRDVGFICHCCRCCCHLIRGINEFGYTKVITTSPFAPFIDDSACSGCGQCVKACPVGALSGAKVATRNGGAPAVPELAEERCIGCGVCVTKCAKGAMKLAGGTRRRILPESSFERVLLQCIERGTLQNLVFGAPNSSQETLRALLGGVLRLKPVQRALVSKAFRSTFLRGLAAFSDLPNT